jgi:hypothetical protein
MPDPDKLSPKKRAALLGCVKNKNKAWSKRHNGKKVPAKIQRAHFSSCAKSTGVENSGKHYHHIMSLLEED